MSGFPILAFLAGRGRDGSGRLLSEVLAFDDAAIEGVHDFIQWCFPSMEPSRAVPGAPVLAPGEAEAIRADPEARAGLARARARISLAQDPQLVLSRKAPPPRPFDQLRIRHGPPGAASGRCAALVYGSLRGVGAWLQVWST